MKCWKTLQKMIIACFLYYFRCHKTAIIYQVISRRMSLEGRLQHIQPRINLFKNSFWKLSGKHLWWSIFGKVSTRKSILMKRVFQHKGFPCKCFSCFKVVSDQEKFQVCQLRRGHPLSTYSEWSEKLTFLIPWYEHVRVRIRRLEMLVFWKSLRTYLRDGSLAVANL